ncbi:MAG: RNA methyltransferase [Oceanospirillaceae bacterium]|jgi:TfoX N-terminal domain.|uniref:TfoX/Sxy family protein n=1 Tax=unclassified Thalassolituus TaxID=2624967 RepID=UPI0000265464|nr:MULTISPECIES: TfoX/Sxy family protein [unclassified Thalassolituus]KZY96182.1 RNA methyltransferase [Oleibacter sp. HI0075]MAG44222.1 RNA methyltransferase [Oceanospirillaceae bacterium]MEC9255051.1 TfoX/Sxy family protein [Pseudomonadota bacterium]KZY99663.1 RNA methyltransferase [Oleibacter sp. HI0075]MEC9408842.1 TfoX/Sxy family protein [Pseudomonadota bacterium]|tara:strand:+ start:3060 stop:3389 length:330 start_codon:yes stop_codon:yes gene_type:complete
MAFDTELAERIRAVVCHFGHWDEKKMFGGLCIMLNGHMLCGVLGDELMVRVGPDDYEDALDEDGTREMDFTGRPLKGMVMVDGAAVAEPEELEYWLQRCNRFVGRLPPK